MIPLYGQLLFYVEEAKMTGCFLGWSQCWSLSTAPICVEALSTLGWDPS